MSRTKEFDPDTVLDRAMDIFWRKGYTATSIQNLVDEMGIQRGSLYATFGSKHELFLAALDRYRARSYQRLQGVFAEAASPRAAIEQALTAIVTDSMEKKKLYGCLLTNSTVELAPHDPDTAARIEEHRLAVEALFRAAIEQGQQSGEFHSNETPEALTNFIFIVIQGLRVMSKTAATRDDLDDAVRITMSVL